MVSKGRKCRKQKLNYFYNYEVVLGKGVSVTKKDENP